MSKGKNKLSTQDLRDVVELFNGDAIIAGGAIRSVVLGQNINDIDLFFNVRDELDIKDMHKEFRSDVWNDILSIEDVKNIDYFYSMSENFMMKYDGTLNLGDRVVDIDFCFYRTREPWNEFHLSIDRLYMNRHGELVLTDDFVKTLTNKTIYFDKAHNNTAFNRARKHLDKISKRFPDYKIVDTVSDMYIVKKTRKPAGYGKFPDYWFVPPIREMPAPRAFLNFGVADDLERAQDEARWRQAEIQRMAR